MPMRVVAAGGKAQDLSGLHAIAHHYQKKVREFSGGWDGGANSAVMRGRLGEEAAMA
nr:hypothetical protein [uncultured Sphingomonas sp.]